MLIVLALALLAVAPAFAEVATVAGGIDVWYTPGDGSSYLDLADTPIPAGFLCANSRPFDGRILWKGNPVSSAPDGALGGADTIVQRLDDVTFDDAGHGVTRLQVKSLSLVGLRPIRTRCGTFQVSANLHGEQPITTMEIVRQGADWGTYQASLALNVALTFTPVDRGGPVHKAARTFVVDTPMTLESDLARWSAKQPAPDRQSAQLGGFVMVDTTGDLQPDTLLPGQSDFFTLGHAVPNKVVSIIEPGEDCTPPYPWSVCHSSGTPGKCHCTDIYAAVE